MFVLPTLENAKLKRIPWATIFIILCCSWVFFVLQHNENEKFEKLIIDSGQNGYFDLELRVYNAFQKNLPESDRAYLVENNDIGRLPEKKDKWKYKEWLDYYGNIWSVTNYHVAYQTSLRANTIKLPEAVNPEMWSEQREAFKSGESNVISLKYAFRTAWPSFLTAFTSTFIHGDLYHLLGNMVFLFIAGTVLEAIVGSWLFLVTYLICSIGVSYLTIPFYGAIATGSIGASGAISAIMGTYSVLLGRTMVPAFVSFGFYFTNMRVPALSLIVFWMGKEILYEFLYPDSRVGYMAHLSGFIIGGAFGAVFKVFKGEEAKALFEEQGDKKNGDIDSLIAKSVEHLRNLEPEEARKCLTNALWIKKDDIAALQQLFIVDLQIGEKKNLKRTAAKLLQIQVKNPEQQDQALANCSGYMKKCDKPLPGLLLVDLSRLAVKKENVQLVEKLINQLQQLETSPDNYPALLLQLTEFYLQKKDVKQANKTAIDLIKKYPDSKEAKNVKALFAAWKRAASV